MTNYQDCQWLYQKYISERLSSLAIAALCDLSHVTILNWLRRFGINRRSLSEARQGKKPALGMKHSRESREKIGRAFRGKKIGPQSPEHRMNLSLAVKGRWLKDKNPRWNNGATFAIYPPEYNEELRERIRRRDKYTCQNPKCKRVQGKRKFPVHHIDWNPKNNDPSNLITHCQACHLDIHAKDRHREQCKVEGELRSK